MGQARCTLKVRGLDCPSEVGPIRGALEGAPGVLGLVFDPPSGTVEVSFDPGATDPMALAGLVESGARMRAEVMVGPLAEGETGGSRAGKAIRHWGPTAVSGVALGVGLVLAALGVWPVVAGAAFAVAVAAGGVELLPKAARSVRRLRLDIHVLMSLAVVGALALGEWNEAAAVAFLFGLSEALEGLSLERAQRAVRSLLEIAPETAERLDAEGRAEVVPASSLNRGDRVRVRSGERVPIDGLVVLGRSSVDQKAITGESVPIPREPGDTVYAGTVNGEGTLEVEASGPLGDAVVSRVVEQVRAAQAGRTPVERTVERFAAYYTPAVVALALLVMVAPPLLGIGGEGWRHWFGQGLVVLVIACPCALVIGTPVAVVSALASAARRGVLIKGGQFLEGFGQLRTLAFDKTGTLTRGQPDVVEVVPTEGRAGSEMLRVAAALGDQGGHVLGRAIARHARSLALEVPDALDYQAVPGLGATGLVDATQVHMGSHRYLDESGLCRPEFHASMGEAEQEVGTSVAVSTPSGPLGWLRLADRPRSEAARVVAELRALGVEPLMLTGDNAPTAAAIARELGITEILADLLPGDKATVMADLDATTRGPAGMVGDGVNDAPALAAARVGVSLGGVSSAAALETADVVLMSEDLSALPWLVRHSRRTRRIIVANIAAAVGAKAVFLVLAVLGLANLWMAILADVGVSLAVVANALRLLRAR